MAQGHGAQGNYVQTEPLMNVYSGAEHLISRLCSEWLNALIPTKCSGMAITTLDVPILCAIILVSIVCGENSPKMKTRVINKSIFLALWVRLITKVSKELMGACGAEATKALSYVVDRVLNWAADIWGILDILLCLCGWLKGFLMQLLLVFPQTNVQTVYRSRHGA